MQPYALSLNIVTSSDSPNCVGYATRKKNTNEQNQYEE